MKICIIFHCYWFSSSICLKYWIDAYGRVSLVMLDSWLVFSWWHQNKMYNGHIKLTTMHSNTYSHRIILLIDQITIIYTPFKKLITFISAHSSKLSSGCFFKANNVFQFPLRTSHALFYLNNDRHGNRMRIKLRTSLLGQGDKCLKNKRKQEHCFKVDT